MTESKRCVDTLEIIHRRRIHRLASELWRCVADRERTCSTPRLQEEEYSEPLSTEDTPLACMKLVARVRTCRWNCKSLRNSRCSSHCRRRCDRDGRHNAQLHQTRGTGVTNLPAPLHMGRNATCHQTLMTPLRCSLPIKKGQTSVQADANLNSPYRASQKTSTLCGHP